MWRGEVVMWRGGVVMWSGEVVMWSGEVVMWRGEVVMFVEEAQSQEANVSHSIPEQPIYYKKGRLRRDSGNSLTAT